MVRYFLTTQSSNRHQILFLKSTILKGYMSLVFCQILYLLNSSLRNQKKSLASFSDKAIEAPNRVKGSMEATDEGFDFSSSLPKNCSNNKTREVLSEKAVAWSHGIDELTQICLDELSYCMIVS